MAKTKMPDPVAPCGLTLVFYYECPHCQEKIPVGAPTQPAVIRCPMCGKKFAIIPVDGYLEQYVEIMTTPEAHRRFRRFPYPGGRFAAQKTHAFPYPYA